MRDRKKRNLLIGSLCCLLVFMGIGYALLTEVLTIDGTATLTGEWRIEITNIITKEVVGSAKNAVDEEKNPISPTYTADKATFAVEFAKPGDKIVYEVTVKNFGTIDAVLSLNADVSLGNKDIYFTNDLESGKILKGGEETTFKVEAKFSSAATGVATGAMSKYTILMVYTQYDGNELYNPTNTTTDNGVFRMESGSITDYNASLGDHVSIPATIDGVPVTSISSDAFREEQVVYNYDVKVALDNSQMPMFAVIFDESKREQLLEAAADLGIVDLKAFSVGDPEIENQDMTNFMAWGYYNLETGLGTPILESSSGFLGESSTQKVLTIKSLDLSNATNLEYIDDYAFSVAEGTYTSEQFMNLSEGLTNLTFGNNDKEIKFGKGVFAGANLDTLKIYTSYISGVTAQEISDGIENGTLSSMHATYPFVGASIQNLIIDSTDSVKQIVTNIASVDGADFYLLMYGAMKSCNNLIISEGITALGTSAFVYSNIENVNLPSTLTNIGENSFAGTGITELILPPKLVSIGEKAFYGNGLTSVVIPSKVTNIGASAFYNNPITTITVKRAQAGMTLGKNWYPASATVTYEG